MNRIEMNRIELYGRIPISVIVAIAKALERDFPDAWCETENERANLIITIYLDQPPQEKRSAKQNE